MSNRTYLVGAHDGFEQFLGLSPLAATEPAPRRPTRAEAIARRDRLAAAAAKPTAPVARPAALPAKPPALARVSLRHSAQGAVWFAEGKSFAEAQQLYVAAIKTENERLKKAVAETQNKIDAAGYRNCLGDSGIARSPRGFA